MAARGGAGDPPILARPRSPANPGQGQLAPRAWPAYNPASCASPFTTRGRVPASPSPQWARP